MNLKNVVIPLTSVMTVTLPNEGASQQRHNPFPHTPPCIQAFGETVTLLPSLQRPRKISIRGTDGILSVNWFASLVFLLHR
jgi:serine/threonine-protein kinase ATR